MVSGEPSISLLSYLSPCITLSFLSFLLFNPVFVSLSFFHFQSLVFMCCCCCCRLSLSLFFFFVSLTHPPITSSSSSPRSLPPPSYLLFSSLFLVERTGRQRQKQAVPGRNVDRRLCRSDVWKVNWHRHLNPLNQHLLVLSFFSLYLPSCCWFNTV